MIHAFPSRLRLPIVAVVLTILALLVAACGSDDNASSKSAAGNAIDLAFVQDMIPHHESAVSMAKVAQQRGGHAEIKKLADDIVTSQSTEISQMRKIAVALKADGIQAGDLGLDESMMGMSMDDMALETANPFDKAFVDMMVPHHQGAIRMARIELSKGASPEAKKLASAIIAAQTREIGEMNSWRMTWYGATSPAGGVPSAGESGQGTSTDEMHGSTHGM